MNNMVTYICWQLSVLILYVKQVPAKHGQAGLAHGLVLGSSPRATQMFKMLLSGNDLFVMTDVYEEVVYGFVKTQDGLTL